MARDNLDITQLTALIESIVAQTLSRSHVSDLETWMTNNPRTANYLSNYHRFEGASGTDELFAQLGQLGTLAMAFGKDKSNANKASGSYQFGAALGGLSGIYGAAKMGDPLGGAAAGAQAGSVLGVDGGIIGAGLGLLAGLFSHGIDKWQRPKFKAASQAYDKLFSLDRGERDEFYLPESAYFRTGSSAAGIVIRLGNQQFDDHIRESLTNNYASQLQRGLVF